MSVSRVIWAGAGLAIALLAVNLIADRSAPAPSLKARTVKDSLTVADSIRAQSAQRRADSLELDSLRRSFRRDSIRTVVRWLPGHTDTVAVVESVMVAGPVIRATADSLATCRFCRDSLALDLRIATISDSLSRRVLDSIAAHPAPTPQPAPSRAAWASAGLVAGVVLSSLSIILSR